MKTVKSAAAKEVADLEKQLNRAYTKRLKALEKSVSETKRQVTNQAQALTKATQRYVSSCHKIT